MSVATIACASVDVEKLIPEALYMFMIKRSEHGMDKIREWLEMTNTNIDIEMEKLMLDADEMFMGDYIDRGMEIVFKLLKKVSN